MTREVYSIYVIRCGDGTLYTGIALDVSRRLDEHQRGNRGAKYLRGRGPLELVYQLPVGDRAAASSVEHRVKQLGRSDKEALVSGALELADLLNSHPAVAPQASGAVGK